MDKKIVGSNSVCEGNIQKSCMFFKGEFSTILFLSNSKKKYLILIKPPFFAVQRANSDATIFQNHSDSNHRKNTQLTLLLESTIRRHAPLIDLFDSNLSLDASHVFESYHPPCSPPRPICSDSIIPRHDPIVRIQSFPATTQLFGPITPRHYPIVRIQSHRTSPNYANSISSSA